MKPRRNSSVGIEEVSMFTATKKSGASRSWLNVPALALALVLFSAILWSVPARADKRVALVIGNADYYSSNWTRLNNAVNDATDIEAALRRLGFEVTLLNNAGKAATVLGLGKFSKAAAGAELALIFYAGHSIEVDKRNFLIPVDASADTPDSAAREAVPLEKLLQAGSKARASGWFSWTPAGTTRLLATSTGQVQPRRRDRTGSASRCARRDPGVVFREGRRPGVRRRRPKQSLHRSLAFLPEGAGPRGGPAAAPGPRCGGRCKRATSGAISLRVAFERPVFLQGVDGNGGSSTGVVRPDLDRKFSGPHATPASTDTSRAMGAGLLPRATLRHLATHTSGLEYEFWNGDVARYMEARACR